MKISVIFQSNRVYMYQEGYDNNAGIELPQKPQEGR